MAQKIETMITRIDDAEQNVVVGDSCLIVFYGGSIGRRYFLNRPTLLLGRSESAEVQVDQESVSRHHAQITVRTDKTASIKDLGSTNGTFVNNERVTDQELKDGDILRIGQTIFKHLSGNNIETKYHEEIYRLTTIDGLTEVYNKRFFLDALERELNRAARYDRVMSLAMFDIDHFKKINDTHGHLAGDQVLRSLSALMQRHVRRQDILARYGGEEFAIILPEVEIAGAKMVCEKLRAACMAHAFSFNSIDIPVTISLGVHSFAGKFETTEDFIGAADKQLYAAKANGRNCVVG